MEEVVVVAAVVVVVVATTHSSTHHPYDKGAGTGHYHCMGRAIWEV